MGRPVKYRQSMINEIHYHGFVKDKLKNREIAKAYNLTLNQVIYILYNLTCTNKDCERCNPPQTITASFLDFFISEDFK